MMVKDMRVKITYYEGTKIPSMTEFEQEPRTPAFYWLYKEGIKAQFKLPAKYEPIPQTVGKWGGVFDHRGQPSNDVAAGYTVCGFTSKYFPDFWSEELYRLLRNNADIYTLEDYVDRYCRQHPLISQFYDLTWMGLLNFLLLRLNGSLWPSLHPEAYMRLALDSGDCKTFLGEVWRANEMYRRSYTIRALGRQFSIWKGAHCVQAALLNRKAM